MNIHVGSTNKTKIKAVEEAILLYPHLFPNPKVRAIAVTVPLFGHPKTLDETVMGAKERAKKAFTNCSYSFGIEGGLMEVSGSRSGFMEVGVCAIYNGTDFYLGLSPAFEWPQNVTQLILENKADASRAFNLLGYTKEKKLGAIDGGIISVLTDRKLTRESITLSSIFTALIYLDKPEFA